MTPQLHRRAAESARLRVRAFFSVALIALLVLLAPGDTASAGAEVGAGAEVVADAGAGKRNLAHTRWSWPVTPAVVVRDYLAPLHEYGPGHRGIDLRALLGDRVVAPTRATVSFAGRVVDRDVVTLTAENGRVISYEPVATTLAVGARVEAGEPIGEVSAGPHCTCLHIGVRIHGVYVSPMREFDSIDRAVLLPW